MRPTISSHSTANPLADAMACRTVYEDLGLAVQGPTALLGDNQAWRDVVVNPGSTQRTRYFDRTTMLVKSFFQRLVIAPYLIVTTLMAADFFTKCTIGEQAFIRCRACIMNLTTHTEIMSNKGERVTLRGKAARLWAKLVNSCYAD